MHIREEDDQAMRGVDAYVVETLASGGQVVNTRKGVLDLKALACSERRLLSAVDGELDLRASEGGNGAGLRCELEGVRLEGVQDRLGRLQELEGQSVACVWNG